MLRPWSRRHSPNASRRNMAPLAAPTHLNGSPHPLQLPQSSFQHPSIPSNWGSSPAVIAPTESHPSLHPPYEHLPALTSHLRRRLTRDVSHLALFAINTMTKTLSYSDSISSPTSFSPFFCDDNGNHGVSTPPSSLPLSMAYYAPTQPPIWPTATNNSIFQPPPQVFKLPFSR